MPGSSRSGFRANYLKGRATQKEVTLDNRLWVRTGPQKQSVLRSLRKPMCGVELLAAARKITPKIRLRDIRLIMRHLEQRKLVHCLNPQAVTGRLYFYSDYGIRLMWEVFGIQLKDPTPNQDWETYSWIVRGKARRAILVELGRPRLVAQKGFTASKLRKAMLPSHAMGLNPLLENLKELEERNLVHCVGRTHKRDLRVMALSTMGQRFYELLTK